MKANGRRNRVPGQSEAEQTSSAGRLGPQEKNDAVYTRPWVVELILDLSAYSPGRNLVDAFAVEPAVGDGSFIVEMARRLVTSCRQQGRPILDCRESLLGYDLDPETAKAARRAIATTLIDLNVPQAEAEILAHGWVRTGDYLVEALALPAADFVIGNPPYVRWEDIDEKIAAAYRVAYSTMRGRADIYIAFFEAGLRQLKPDGVCTYICADRWMLNQYGAQLRALVTSSYSVETIIEMHSASAFKREVSVYPAITVIRRGSQGPVVVARAKAEAASAKAPQLIAELEATRTRHENGRASAEIKATLVERWFEGTDPWPCLSAENLHILRRLEHAFLPLESAETGTKIGIGVATGCDDVFITTDPDLVESSRLMPLALVSDTVNGTFRWSGHYLVNPWSPDGLVNLAKFPRLAAYFERHRNRLQQRHVALRKPDQWYRTIDRVRHDLTGKHKLLVPDIKERIHPVLDDCSTYPHHNLYFITSDEWDLEVLGGLLLSDVAQFFIECYATRMGGGYLRFQAQYLRRIRVPRPREISPEQAEGLRRAFRQRDLKAATAIARMLYGFPT